MEELDYSRYFHFHHDLRLLYDDCWWTTSTHDHCKKKILQIFLLINKIIFLDTRRSSEMLSRNHFDWLSSLSHSWVAMVSKSLLVFPSNIKLLLLR